MKWLLLLLLIPQAPATYRPLQESGANVVRFEIHFNVQGTGFDGTIKRGV